MSAESVLPTRKPSECRIAEVLQYSCEVETDAVGRPQFHCFPVPRIFRICPGRPAVEITRLVNIDLTTGEVQIPPESNKSLPKAKVWRDITRYESTNGSEIGRSKSGTTDH